jgi:cyclophilin family peptidyl-prolyl cis-trans isomerase
MKQVLKHSLLLILLIVAMPSFGGIAKKAEKDTLVVIGTAFGEMTVVLYAETPEHRKNFLKLASEHFFDSTTFHRIIKGFMIQGGDPNSKDSIPYNDGQGGPGYTIPGEFNPAFTHVQGALAAARMGDQVNPEKRSSGSQFYLVENPAGTPFLNNNYSVFGLTIKGIDVIQKIADQPKSKADRPSTDIKMWVKLVVMKKEKVTETFGYDYVSHSVKPELIKNSLNSEYEVIKISGNKEPVIKKSSDKDPNYCDKPKAPANLMLQNLVFEDANGNGIIEADEKCTLNFDLSNSGKGHACQLKISLAEMGANNSGIHLSPIEVLQELAPNERKKFSLLIQGTMKQTSGKTTLILSASEKNGFDADPVKINITVQAFQEPKVEMVDSKFSSITGSMQTGVSISLRTAIQNTGSGTAENVKVKIKLPETNVFLSTEEEIEIPFLKPGESQLFDFEFVANKRYTQPTVPCIITITEKYGKYGSTKTSVVTMNQKLSTPQMVEVKAKEMKSEKFVSVSLNSDVDKNLPVAKSQNPDAVAVVIGNQHYQKTKSVDYAINDAASIKNYLVQVLGFREGNILYFTDAGIQDFNDVFGKEKGSKGMLFDRVKPNVSDVFVYYSGHGAPDLGEGGESKGYIVPVGCNPNYVSNGGYSLETFYHNLEKLPARTVTVVLDACFSGEDLIQKASPMIIKPKYPQIQKATVLASSRESQVSNWYVSQEHGLFTYFFLKAIQKKELSDKNKDGKLTLEEIYQFVADMAEGVPYESRRMFGSAREQNPVLLGIDKTRILVDFGK